MPYITQESREEIDKYLIPLLDNFRSSGALAYIVYRILTILAKDRTFGVLATYYGAVELALLEFKRRKIDPYEDAKRQENGDIE